MNGYYLATLLNKEYEYYIIHIRKDFGRGQQEDNIVLFCIDNYIRAIREKYTIDTIPFIKVEEDIENLDIKLNIFIKPEYPPFQHYQTLLKNHIYDLIGITGDMAKKIIKNNFANMDEIYNFLKNENGNNNNR